MDPNNKGDGIYDASTENTVSNVKVELVDTSKIDIEKFKEVRKKYGNILSEKITTLEEEVDMFYRFYSGILKDLGIENYETISMEIAIDRTYGFDKYELYEGIYESSNMNDFYDDTKYIKKLEEIWKYEKILLDYNIIDFTSKYK